MKTLAEINWKHLNYWARMVYYAFDLSIIIHDTFPVIYCGILIFTCIFFLSSVWLLGIAFSLLWINISPFIILGMFIHVCVLWASLYLRWSPASSRALIILFTKKCPISAYLVIVVLFTRACLVSCISAELVHHSALRLIDCSCQSSVCFSLADGLWEWGSRAALLYWTCTCQIEFKLKADCLLQRSIDTAAWWNTLKHSLRLQQVRILLRTHFSTSK